MENKTKKKNTMKKHIYDKLNLSNFMDISLRFTNLDLQEAGQYNQNCYHN